MRLEHEARQPQLGEAPGQADVVDPALDHVGPDVDVQVVRAADQIARRIRRSLGRLPGGAHVFAGSSTTGVPYVWKLSTVCTPQAWPLARSASVHTVASGSGSKTK